MGRIDQRLKELGLIIPDVVAPVANYVGYVVSGSLIFVSGQITLERGEKKYIGKLGSDFDVKEGQQAARLCAVNIIAQLKAACNGDLDRIKRIVRLGGFVNSTPDFTDQPQVINGASDLMVDIFGDKGRHSRAAVSVNALPFGVAVEIDAVAEFV